MHKSRSGNSLCHVADGVTERSGRSIGLPGTPGNAGRGPEGPARMAGSRSASASPGKPMLPPYLPASLPPLLAASAGRKRHVPCTLCRSQLKHLHWFEPLHCDSYRKQSSSASFHCPAGHWLCSSRRRKELLFYRLPGLANREVRLAASVTPRHSTWTLLAWHR